jgi:predicted ATPase/DNA-binding winged helix-turn-helix (wHTH) protein
MGSPVEAGLSAIGEGAYCFGEYRFLLRRQLLLRGETPVRLGARALDLLQILIERQGELVSKSDLMRFAWPDTFVHESNLKVNIAALRRALPQERTELPYIVTVSGRGYRFAAPVRLETDAEQRMTLSQGGFDNGLPVQRTVVGRDNDVTELCTRVCDRRFVTIVGPAGVGKTTVAVAAARKLAERFGDGACFVDLAAINDSRLVCAAIAASLGSGAGLVDLLAGIVESLRTTNKLLILDNCEHVLSAAGLVAQHIHSALPHIGIIATSREPFGCQAENIYRLSPLRCPAGDMRIDGGEAMAFPAVELFVTRALEATGYRLSDPDAPVVADICRRLDGIPLAIELAAPRLKTCDPATLLRHLNRSFELLNYGPRTAPLRHQALQATLDWSYRLLSEAEAMLLRRLSVFAGTFMLEDVLCVANDVVAPPSGIAVCLENLASKSLVSQAAIDSRWQYRLLDATRSYADERLRAAGEHQRACEAHAGYLRRLFERAEAEWAWHAREDWVVTYGRRANDLRKAIDWAFGEDGDADTGVRLTVAAIPLWDELSSVGESRQRTRTALDAAKAVVHCDPVLRMKLATAHARSLSFTERLEPEAEAACLESVRLADMYGDADYQLRSVWGLAVLQSFAGRHREVLASLDRFDAIAERVNDRSAAPAGARFRLMTQFYRGDIVGAHRALTKLAERHDKLVRRSRISRFQVDPYVVIRVSLAFVAWVRGDVVEAARTAKAAVDGATAIGHLVSQSNALALASIPIALWMNDLDAAEGQLAVLVDNLNRRDLASWAPLSHFFGAAIRHQRGDADAVDQMHLAADEILASKFLLRAPIYLGKLAEAALQRGRGQLARSSIAAALEHAERQDEVWCQPELLRVLGLVERHHGDRGRAEQTLLRAVQIAGKAGALSFQLRAASDLAETWADAGRGSAAVALLEPICRQFAPEIAGVDISKARRVLEQVRAEATFDRRKFNGYRGRSTSSH